MKEKQPPAGIRISPAFAGLCVLALVSENTVPFIMHMGALTLHEAAHLVMAHMLGCSIYGIKLLPYGCRMDIANMDSLWDELMIALCGPVCSLICYIGCRLIPGAVAFAEANMYIALVNLLPAYPLDGGRAINALLIMLGMRPRRMLKGVTALIFAAAMAAAGIVICNATMVIFAVFLLSEGINALREKSGSMIAHMKNMRCASAGRGIRVQHIALRQDTPLWVALSYGLGRYSVFCILDEDMRERARVDGVRLAELAAEHGSSSTLEEILPYVDRGR